MMAGERPENDTFSPSYLKKSSLPCSPLALTPSSQMILSMHSSDSSAAAYLESSRSTSAPSPDAAPNDRNASSMKGREFVRLRPIPFPLSLKIGGFETNTIDQTGTFPTAIININMLVLRQNLIRDLQIRIKSHFFKDLGLIRIFFQDSNLGFVNDSLDFVEFL